MVRFEKKEVFTVRPIAPRVTPEKKVAQNIVCVDSTLSSACGRAGVMTSVSSLGCCSVLAVELSQDENCAW